MGNEYTRKTFPETIVLIYFFIFGRTHTENI
jgi:hypothetical protein